MVLGGSVYQRVDVIVSIEDKGYQYTRVISVLNSTAIEDKGLRTATTP